MATQPDGTVICDICDFVEHQITVAIADIRLVDGRGRWAHVCNRHLQRHAIRNASGDIVWAIGFATRLSRPDLS